MKKILLPLLLIAFLCNSYAQYVCLGTEETNDFRDECTRVFPIDIYDTEMLALSYIPNESTPIITIPVNINIWRKDDGTGNWWQDTPAFRDSLRLAFDYLNFFYSHNVIYSLYIPNTQFVTDTRVRFVIDTFYYYNNTEMAYKINSVLNNFF